MTVQELISKLEKFDGNLEVWDASYCEIEEVKESTYVDSNYPYSKPDKLIVLII